MKIRGGAEGEGEDESAEIGQTESQQPNDDAESGQMASASATTAGESVAPKQKISKLDAIFTKTENAHFSMEHQTEQMKSFLQ